MKKSKLKKLSSLMLTLSMVATLFIGMTGTASAINITGNGTQEDPWVDQDATPGTGISVYVANDGFLVAKGNGATTTTPINRIHSFDQKYREKYNTTIKKVRFLNCTTLSANCINRNGWFPDTVMDIDTYKDVTDIEMDDTVEEISEDCFMMMDKLKNIKFSKNLKKIGTNAFALDSALETIEIPASDDPNNVLEMGIGVFKGCKNLKTVKIYPKLKDNTLPDSTFSHVYRVDSNTQEEELIYCDNLQKVILNNSTTQIADSAFRGCQNLSSLEGTSNVETIGRWGFLGCKKLTNLSTLFPNLKTLGQSSFKSCSSLKNADVAHVISKLVENNATSIPENVFSDCGGLTEVEIPLGITKVENYVFDGCVKLKKLTIKDENIIIGSGAFNNCSSLDTINEEGSISEIGVSGFGDDIGLKTLTLKNDISIGESGFAGCTNLKDITFNGDATLDQTAFGHCNALKTITFNKKATLKEQAMVSINKPTIIFKDEATINNGAFSSGYSVNDLYQMLDGVVPGWQTNAAKKQELTDFLTGMGWESIDQFINVNSPAEAYMTIPDPWTINGASVAKDDLISDETADTPAYQFGGILHYGISAPTPTSGGKSNGNPVPIRNVNTKSEGIHGTYKVDKPFVINGEDVKIIATPDEGYEIDKIYVDGKEVKSLEIKNVTKDTKVEVTFKKIGEKKGDDKSKDTQKEEVQKIKKQVSKAQFVARSKVTKLRDGKPAIRVRWYDGKNIGVKFDGYEVYRSTDRQKGYGTKPIFKTKNKYYYNTKIEEGVKYYYKVKAYKVVDGKKIYTDYSLKAWREI